MENLVSIENLRVGFDREPEAVRGVSLWVQRGEVFALIGESGCGKSVTAQALLRLNPPNAAVTATTLRLGGVDMLRATQRQLEQVRGGVAGMVFQDPMSCLNPTMKVGRQITERLRRRDRWPAARCRQEAARLLELVQVPDAAQRANQYPHQLSGGMRQRAMLAMALSANPALLIADEPTTALDVTTQLQILRLLADIRQRLGTAVLLITHDFSVVANLADRVAVMYAGRLVEQGPTASLFDHPAHPYTQALLEGSVRLGADTAAACAYAGRCTGCMKICLEQAPPMLPVAPHHTAACWGLRPGAGAKGGAL